MNKIIFVVPDRQLNGIGRYKTAWNHINWNAYKSRGVTYLRFIFALWILQDKLWLRKSFLYTNDWFKQWELKIGSWEIGIEGIFRIGLIVVFLAFIFYILGTEVRIRFWESIIGLHVIKRLKMVANHENLNT